ncbi:MAG TPA: GH116 family glycosyl-hydrolase, partial [Thermoanaerobaculaceae bacterium]|nr:GH116 family glycosyl-hydrolase [Thermoanaerobaculaceae bacterium]
FHQDWYIPLPTTPETTGMSLGGIGSSVTITPAATTPVFNFVPGIQVGAKEGESFRFSNFFYRERSHEGEELYFADYAAFKERISHYPLMDANNRALFDPKADEHAAMARVKEVISSTDFWTVNRERFERWQIQLNPFTRRLESSGDLRGFHRASLLDFFMGALAEKVETWFSLTGDWHEKEISGATCYPCAQMRYGAYFPVSVTEYKGHQGVEVSRAQYSAIVPGDEKLCSLPVWYTVFKLCNPGPETREVTLLQTQENFCGFQVIKERPGVQDASFLLLKTACHPRGTALEIPVETGVFRGVGFDQHEGNAGGDIQGSMAIGVVDQGDADMSVVCMPEYYSAQETEVTASTMAVGHPHIIINKKKYTGKELMSGAVSATIRLAAGATREVVFITALDFPAVSLFRTQKKYTSFFGDSPTRIADMLTFAASREADIRAKVLAGQDEMVSAAAIAKLGADPQEVQSQGCAEVARSARGAAGPQGTDRHHPPADDPGPGDHPAHRDGLSGHLGCRAELDVAPEGDHVPIDRCVDCHITQQAHDWSLSGLSDAEIRTCARHRRCRQGSGQQQSQAHRPSRPRRARAITTQPPPNRVSRVQTIRPRPPAAATVCRASEPLRAAARVSRAWLPSQPRRPPAA